jgi:hypothetical protein
MAFLRRLFGSKAQSTGGQNPVLLRGTDPLEVVGESYRQEGLRALVGRSRDYVRVPIVAVLAHEPNNRGGDPNAIAVWITDKHVGYLSREDAGLLLPGLLALQLEHRAHIALAGVIAGGGEGRPSYGVFLEFPAAAFGVSASERPADFRRQPSVEIRTGFHNAIDQDAANDDFDLSWESRVPGDRLQAIAYLRRTLGTETQPVSRHFLFASLADHLYAAREQFNSALDEFDEVCRQHDAEMDAIRPALIATFGGLPLLEVYKQSAIRHQKRQDIQRAMWWAQRGLEVYGTEGINPEFAADLSRRIEKFNAKLAPKPARVPREAGPRADVPTSETLNCRTCGLAFDRERTRGRKPAECPSCRGIAIDA